MRVVLPVLLLFAVLSPTSAQTIRGQLDSPAGEPVPGALITLVRTDGAPERAAVSDSTGAFGIETGDTGSFALRVERMGRAAFTSAPFRVEADRTHTLTLVVHSELLGLGDLRSTTSPCVPGPGTGAPAELWAHAERALRISALAEESRLLDVSGVRYLRLLDTQGEIQQGVIDQEPFAGSFVPHPAPPAGLLGTVGFTATDLTGALIYHVPSPAALLSSEFLGSHCLHRVIVEKSGLRRIGLGFRPLPRSTGVGVEGVLWLDRATAEVRSIEFQYRDPSRKLPRGARGLIALRVGAHGLPQISRWWLRVPRVFQTLYRGGGQDVNTGVVESGAIALGEAGRPLEDPEGIYAMLGTMFKFDPIEVQARRALSVMSEGALTRIRPDELLGAPATDAGAIVSLLRPGWLARAQAWKLTEDGAGGDCVVYLDRMRWSREGVADSAGDFTCRDALATIPASWIASIEYVPPIEAAAIYGLGHGYGVIVIRSRRQ